MKTIRNIHCNKEIPLHQFDGFDINKNDSVESLFWIQCTSCYTQCKRAVLQASYANGRGKASQVVDKVARREGS